MVGTYSVVTLLVASVSTLRVGALVEGKPQMPVNKNGILLEALTIQVNNAHPDASNNRNTYGSTVQQNIKVKSPDSSRPSKTYTRTVIAPGGPGHQGVSYANSDGSQHREQTNKIQKRVKRGKVFFGSFTRQENNTYRGNASLNSDVGSLTIRENEHLVIKGNNQDPQNGDQLQIDSDNIPKGSFTDENGNTYQLDPNSENHFGSVTIQKNNRYEGRSDSNTPNSSKKATKTQEQSEKEKAPNGQLRTFDNFSLYLVLSTVLLKYCLF